MAIVTPEIANTKAVRLLGYEILRLVHHKHTEEENFFRAVFSFSVKGRI